MRKQYYRWLITVCVVLLCLTGCGTDSAGNGYRGKVNGVQFSLPDLGETVYQHTQLQSDCLTDIRNSDNFEKGLLYVQGVEEKSRPEPVKLSWTAQAKAPIQSYTVSLSKQETMETVFYQETTVQTNLDVYNLELGTTYYWTVTANMDGKTATSGTARFTTASDGPRNLYIEGITNARDLGGWRTEDGGKVRQGMIYRAGRLNTSSLATVNVEITEQGIRMLRDVLGVKTEIDVRGNHESSYLRKSPLGDAVAYYRFPMEWDGNILRDNPAQIRQVFALLAEEDNYPLVIHCNIGTDRTGLLCFLVNALLGVSEDDLCMDYFFSNFGVVNGSRSVNTILENYMPGLQEMEGDTLSRKTYNYLVKIGVPEAQLDAVIQIMKEPAA